MTRVLVANRGEIAVRVVRAAHDLGWEAVAVHSEADAEAPHVRMADAAVEIGPPPAGKSYLVIEAVVEAAKESGAEAVHPGYGFLSERADLARAVEDAGLAFAGPSGDHIALMGDKARAREAAADAGVPTVPGSDGPVADAAEAADVAEEIGFPVALKAAGGGGGRGAPHRPRPGRPGKALPPALGGALRRVRRRPRLRRALRRARPPRRGAGPRGRGPRHPPGRARVLAAAPPPEGA